jgi:hypothetical protein
LFFFGNLHDFKSVSTLPTHFWTKLYGKCSGVSNIFQDKNEHILGTLAAASSAAMPQF